MLSLQSYRGDRRIPSVDALDRGELLVGKADAA